MAQCESLGFLADIFRVIHRMAEDNVVVYELCELNVQGGMQLFVKKSVDLIRKCSFTCISGVDCRYRLCFSNGYAGLDILEIEKKKPQKT